MQPQGWAGRSDAIKGIYGARLSFFECDCDTPIGCTACTYTVPRKGAVCPAHPPGSLHFIDITQDKITDMINNGSKSGRVSVF